MFQLPAKELGVLCFSSCKLSKLKVYYMPAKENESYSLAAFIFFEREVFYVWRDRCGTCKCFSAIFGVCFFTPFHRQAPVSFQADDLRNAPSCHFQRRHADGTDSLCELHLHSGGRGVDGGFRRLRMSGKLFLFQSPA